MTLYQALYCETCKQTTVHAVEGENKTCLPCSFKKETDAELKNCKAIR